jgi:cytoskeletal protein CcmA (bactofilin family)
VFEGNLVVPHSLRIDGRVKGRIETGESLTVGPTGIIEADIKAKSLICGGKIIGNVVAEDRIELESKASLTGDIQTRELIINEGAYFQGNSRMEANSRGRNGTIAV